MKTMLFIWLILLGALSSTFSQINYQLYKQTPLGPVGGGIGYTNIVPNDETFTTVCTLTELRDALSNPLIKKIYIPGDLSFTVDTPLVITTDDLILASDRGIIKAQGTVSPGALLLLNTQSVLISIKANNVRISGLRLACSDVSYRSAGIQMKPKSGLSEMHIEIDNCELYHWGYAAIQIEGYGDDTNFVARGSIHHNYIHHNNKTGLGYGSILCFKNVEAQFLYNLYDENRHSIAGHGMPGETYTAAYNLTLKNSMISEYDMHGYSDYNKLNCTALQLCNPYDPFNNAGSQVILLNNAILQANISFLLRGIPPEGAFLINNYFNGPNRYKLWRPWTYTDTHGPCLLTPPADQLIILDQEDWEANHLYVENNSLVSEQYVHYVNWSGSHNEWTPLFFNSYAKGKLAFGDFNGDQITDIFYSDGLSWKISWNGVTPWEELNTYNQPLEQLHFGDFNGDGSTDIFRVDGNLWKVSWSGASDWQIIASSSAPEYQLAFEDFDGDGKTDVFRATGTVWRISSGGASSWQTLAVNSATIDELCFGDFDGDGRTDVFRIKDGQWQVSWCGSSNWNVINYSEDSTDQLVFEDFNGDTKTDVLKTDGSHWMISWGGTTAWQLLRESPYVKSELFFGDFNGDGKSDVLREEYFEIQENASGFNFG